LTKCPAIGERSRFRTLNEYQQRLQPSLHYLKPSSINMKNNLCSAGRMFPWKGAVLCLVFLAATAGCGSKNIAQVRGTVKFAGAPVKGGTLIFGPVGEGKVGQPASATISPDGTFVLGTNGTTDGALIGRHRVVFTPPPQSLTEKQRSDPNYEAPPPEYYGMVPKEAEVEVKVGQNTMEIELMPEP
jgi:hypothetical protein